MNSTIIFIASLGLVCIVAGYSYLGIAFWQRRRLRKYRKLIQQKMEILAKLREEMDTPKSWVNVFQPNFEKQEVQL